MGLVFFGLDLFLGLVGLWRILPAFALFLSLLNEVLAELVARLGVFEVALVVAEPLVLGVRDGPHVGLVDCEVLNGHSRSLGCVHVHEPVEVVLQINSLTVFFYDFDLVDCPVAAKVVAQHFLGGVQRQVPNVQLNTKSLHAYSQRVGAWRVDQLQRVDRVVYRVFVLQLVAFTQILLVRILLAPLGELDFEPHLLGNDFLQVLAHDVLLVFAVFLVEVLGNLLKTLSPRTLGMIFWIWH